MIVSDSTTSTGEISAGISSEIVAACKKWNLCDAFCLMLYAVLERHLQEYSTTVTWARFDVAPRIYLTLNGEPQEDFPHSVLVVQTPSEELFFFDCTGQQFGWSSSDWLTTNITRKLADVRVGWDDGAETLESTRQEVFKNDDSYWKSLTESFDVMFENFDWNIMANKGCAEMKRWVQQDAEGRAQAVALATWG